MQNVILIIHLLLALCLIGVVLLQRSEGGGLGIGGGGGGVMSGRAPTTPLGKLTWVFAVAFITTSITLTILAAQNAGDTSVLDRLGTGASGEDAPAERAPTAPDIPQGESLLPPASDDAPALPPRAD